MPRKVFVAGEILTAADVNTNLMDQSVMVFADDTARTSAIPSPSEGMVTYRSDDDVVEVFDGSVFAPVGVEPAILQVVSTTKTDTFTTSSASFVDVTGLSASITPSSASNDILVSVTVPCGNNSGGEGVMATVADGSNNNLIAATSPGSRIPAMGAHFAGSVELYVMSIVFLHSPATTSSFTYKVRGRRVNGVAQFNRAGDDTDSAARARTTSSITLMEVAG